MGPGNRRKKIRPQARDLIVSETEVLDVVEANELSTTLNRKLAVSIAAVATCNCICTKIILGAARRPKCTVQSCHGAVVPACVPFVAFYRKICQKIKYVLWGQWLCDGLGSVVILRQEQGTENLKSLAHLLLTFLQPSNKMYFKLVGGGCDLTSQKIGIAKYCTCWWGPSWCVACTSPFAFFLFICTFYYQHRHAMEFVCQFTMPGRFVYYIKESDIFGSSYIVVVDLLFVIMLTSAFFGSGSRHGDSCRKWKKNGSKMMTVKMAS